MPDKATGTGAAFDAIVKAAESEGRKLTTKERLANPVLQRELVREKANTIRSAERAVEKAEQHLDAAELALTVAKKENA
jgi:hypothetical protein